MKKREIMNVDWEEVNLQGENGYILECSLTYPNHLHETHSSYPLAVESKIISLDMLSPYAKECHTILKGKDVKYKSKKLTATFEDREHYVVHFATLKFYLEMGMKIKKIHRVLTFKQKAFLKSYIDYCTLKRSLSSSPFEQNVWKLMANSVFGKMIENIRNYMTCSFVTNAQQCARKISQTNFDHFKVVNEDFVITYTKEKSLVLNKPYAVGFGILEWSKYFMYKSYYKDIAPRFSHIKVLFSDTDSFLLSVRVNDKNKEEKKDPTLVISNIMDYSNYPSYHPLHNMSRKNQLGFFKNETKGGKIHSFIGIKSKTYAMKLVINDKKRKNNVENIIRRTKGIAKGYRSTLTFDMFKKCIQEIREERVTQYQIQSKNHSLHTMKVSKIAFSSFCDKRYILKHCAMHSVPYGSELIDRYPTFCPFCKNILF